MSILHKIGVVLAKKSIRGGCVISGIQLSMAPRLLGIFDRSQLMTRKNCSKDKGGDDGSPNSIAN